MEIWRGRDLTFPKVEAVIESYTRRKAPRHLNLEKAVRGRNPASWDPEKKK